MKKKKAQWDQVIAIIIIRWKILLDKNKGVHILCNIRGQNDKCDKMRAGAKISEMFNVSLYYM
jgi:hypothetical protein